ncbi:transglutaminaseTgpA domain-containing protein [Planctomicrobium sp. SH527]|uniref:transglutaminase family protein n=1 Tax=Planctomicrobium sp. SH527 TaxID=3448123 RepID=UPI003F5AE9E4
MSTVNDDWFGIRRLPNLQRTAAVILILIQNFCLATLIQPCPLPVTALALAGWFAPQFRLQIRVPALMVGLSIMAFYLYRSRFVIHDFSAKGFIGTEGAYEIACACITMQLAMLFLKSYSYRLPIWFLAISSIGIVLSEDVRVSTNDRATIVSINMIYLACWVFFAASSRVRVLQKNGHHEGWLRFCLIGIVLTTSLYTSQRVSNLFQKYGNQLERFVSNLLFSKDQFNTSQGFSGTGGLSDVSSIRQFGNRDIALTIRSTDRPDYLRGIVFDYFRGNRWHMTGEKRPIIPSVGRGSNDADENGSQQQFLIAKNTSQQSKEMVIDVLEKQIRGNCFMPLNTYQLTCHSLLIYMSTGGTIRRDSENSRATYTIHTGTLPKVPWNEINPIYLQVPDEISPYVEDLANAIGKPHRTSTAKINAVTEFLQNEFKYSIEHDLIAEVDRLDHFLMKRMPAHCEYFATSAVILLRLQGIPARYVTGFVVSNQNQINGEWIVRNEDAHAWAEAYDVEEQCWKTVEATPGNGIPISSQSGFFEAWKDAITIQFRRLLNELSSADFWNQMILLLRTTSVIVGISVLFILALGIGWKRYSPSFNLLRDAHPLAKERLRMDHVLKRHGFSRRISESVLTFATRIEKERNLTTSQDLATWYRDYASLRFNCDSSPGETDLHDLQLRRKNLAAKTKGLS